MNILVTGGGGFMGLHVVEALAKANHCITVISRNGLQKNIVGEIRVIKSTYGDTEILNAVLKNIDVVIHIAWTSVPKEGVDFINSEIKSDVLESISLFSACAANKIKKIIFISSGGTVYGFPKQIPVPEIHGTDPASSYGISKLTVEKYLQLFNRLSGMGYVIFRVSNAYGEHQNITKGQGVIGYWMDKIRKGDKIEIWGDGTVVRDYIYISDIVKVIAQAATDENFKNDIYNLGSGTGNSLNDILAIFKELHPTVEVRYTETRKVDVNVNILDISKLKDKINFSATYTLEEGIKKIWNQTVSQKK